MIRDFKTVVITGSPVDAITSVKGMQGNVVPPTNDTNEAGPEWLNRFNLTLSKAQPKEINYALSDVIGAILQL